MGRPAKEWFPPCWGLTQPACGQHHVKSERGTPSGSVPKHSGEEELGVSSLGVKRLPGSPKFPHTVFSPWPIPVGLWATEGVDDELAPPESQWLVLPLPLGLPLAGGDGEDSDGELCWFMHWATAKPARQGGDMTKWEERSRPGRGGCHLPQLCVGPCRPDPHLKSGAGA